MPHVQREFDCAVSVGGVEVLQELLVLLLLLYELPLLAALHNDSLQPGEVCISLWLPLGSGELGGGGSFLLLFLQNHWQWRSNNPLRSNALLAV